MINTLPDIIAEGLSVLFCGINPALSAAAAGHHFSNRNNRFWRAIHLAGFTPAEIPAVNDRSILHYHCGLTAVVERPTARADQLSAAEFAAATARFEQKIVRYAPRFVAFLGKPGFAALSGKKEVTWGEQAMTIGDAVAWVLPNPSGRNRAFSLDQLVTQYRELHRAVNQS